jgi:hypothetical protein
MRWRSLPRPAAPLAAVAAVSLVLPWHAAAQTYSSCNPLQSTQCPAGTALGMTVNVDFSQGEVNSFVASGSPSYGSDGVSFTVTQGGDAPQLASIFYIMFGHVEIVLKAAPGAGIVSSVVLQSDTLDEIDLEWLGSDADEMQSNYFGKGEVTTYNRGQFHSVEGTQANFKTYSVDWTNERIIWAVDGTQLRELRQEDADSNQYPQTPMRLIFGAWAGGDPNHNAPGTVSWARGPTDYSQGPFTMMVQRVSVTDYSTGSEYKYSDTSGNWESIEAVDGEVNGNIDGAGATQTLTATSAGTAATGTSDSVPTGIGTDENGATATIGTIPDGWRMTPEGKIVPNAAAGLGAPHAALLVAGSFVLGFAGIVLGA